MKIRANWSAPPGASAIAIGNFDGVHAGHRHLLERLGEAAGAELVTLALSFEPHPLGLLEPARAPCRLVDLRTKAGLLAERGVAQLNVVGFTRALSMLDPAEFVRRLVGQLKMRKLVVGSDFRFGHRRAGDVGLLARLAGSLGFELVECADWQLDGKRVSSKLVRGALGANDFAGAARLLGRPYRFGGRVVAGQALGAELGCATANVRFSGTPALAGIYAANCYLNGEGEALPAALYVGGRSSVAGAGPVVEAHLLDFTRDVYGAYLTIEPRAFLHGERTYADLAELSAGIAADVAACRKLLAA